VTVPAKCPRALTFENFGVDECTNSIDTYVCMYVLKHTYIHRKIDTFVMYMHTYVCTIHTYIHRKIDTYVMYI
jgi:hypothetical protein